MEGSPADRSAKNDCCPTYHKMIRMKEHTDPESPDKVSTEETAVASGAMKISEIVIAQRTATERAENAKSETKDKLRPELLFNVARKKLLFPLSLRTRYKLTSE